MLSVPAGSYHVPSPLFHSVNRIRNDSTFPAQPHITWGRRCPPVRPQDLPSNICYDSPKQRLVYSENSPSVVK